LVSFMVKGVKVQDRTPGAGLLGHVPHSSLLN
jgi:hypothetical protein